MLEIQSTITSIIFILFPILIYYIYVAHKKNIKEKQKGIILEVLIMISLLLNILFYLKGSYDILLLFIPLLLAYLNDKKIVAICTSVILVEFYYNIYHFSLIITIILVITLFVTYLIIISKKDKKKFTYYFMFIISIFFIIFFLLNKNIILKQNYYLFANLFIFYCATTLTIYCIQRSIEIMRFFMTIKEIENEKMIQLSLFKITHEIKNPIAVIKGYLDMFDSNNTIKSEKYIKIISEEVNRTLNILNDLSSLSKIKIKKEIMDIHILFEDIKEVIIPFCNVKKAKYNFEIENEELEINADYHRLKQVILNVLKNAIEACDKNGEIKCICYNYLDNIYIIIKDNGIGMTNEEIKNMFTPFNSSKSDGTGLGVFLSKEIIEAHGGKIIYKSAKHKGTSVKIKIPIH